MNTPDETEAPTGRDVRRIAAVIGQEQFARGWKFGLGFWLAGLLINGVLLTLLIIWQAWRLAEDAPLPQPPCLAAGTCSAVPPDFYR